jgi:ribokinase
VLYVVGSVNLDLIARLDRVPAAGETVIARGGTVAPGGKGANQALAARRMGAPVALVAEVGDDGFRTPALRLLEQDGVDLRHVRTASGSTGVALIWVNPSGDNAIAVMPGANQTFAPSRFDPGPDLAPGDAVLISMEVPENVVAAAAAWAARYHAPVFLDPAPAPEALASSLYRVDVLMPNRGEAERILRVAIPDVRAAKWAAEKLVERGARVGIVKLGSEGVVFASRHGVFVHAARPVEAVDTTGAGDCFAGVLAAALIEGMPVADAVARASDAAALSVTRPGAQPSFPYASELDDLPG